MTRKTKEKIQVILAYIGIIGGWIYVLKIFVYDKFLGNLLSKIF